VGWRAKPRSRPHRGRLRGFTYIGLLIFIAVLTAISGAGLRYGLLLERHVAEEELIARGLRLSGALQSYALATPAGQSKAPKDIADLLRDPRYPDHIVRHLRRVEIDPMTGTAEWGVVMLTVDQKGISGFHSLSMERPRRQLFNENLKDFNDAEHYSDWIFVAGMDSD